MSRHSNRRLFGVVTAGAALAALLTTGTASAQSVPGPNAAACEAAKTRVTELTGDLERAQRAVTELRSEAAATNEPAVDPDSTQVDPEGDPTGLDGAADVSEGPLLDTDEPPVDPDGAGGPLPAVDPDAVQVDPEGDPTGLDGALDRSEGAPLDTNEAPVDPDGAEGISPAEQREIDRAVRVANRVARNLDNAKARRDKVCTPVVEPTNPPVAAPAAGDTTVVWCVLRPGQCSEVEVDSEGRLIREIRTVECRNDRVAQLPRASGTTKGQKVTVIKQEEFVPETSYLPGTGNSDPGTYSIPQASAPSVQSGGSYPAVTG